MATALPGPEEGRFGQVAAPRAPGHVHPAVTPLAMLGLAGLLALLAVAAAASAGAPGAILDDGSVRLGVHADGALDSPGGSASSGTATTTVGLRWAATNAEGVADGCCEGWGLAHDGVAAWALA